MANPPSGTVTFLFTDIEGSTRRWQDEPEAMRSLLVEHDAILREVIDRHRGHVFKHTGDGVAAVFSSASDAVSAAADGQERLREVLPVRMGLHTGEAELRDGDYFGSTLNRCARLMSIGHGGQILVSGATAALVADDSRYELLNLGEHRLRDLARAEHVFQARAPGLGEVFPPLRSLSEMACDLPQVLTSFVGRERELALIAEALEHARVVTIIGVGGVGKTRVALQVAADMSTKYPDGVWFCELAAVRDRDSVPDAVASTLSIRTPSAGNVADTLITFLRAKRLLLVLDNCEHVIDAAGSLVDGIVHACRDVRVLCTSREALDVDGEFLRPIGSLPVPAQNASFAENATTSSVRLFADRAVAVRPEFVLDERSAATIASICRQLDGVPLAIELAAARIAALTIHDIERRLGDRFRLLTGGRRTALERHQTLRATVDWSYELLRDEERHVFDRLSVFTGGFTIDDAEAVTSGDGVDGNDVFDVLSRLVGRSMIFADDVYDITRYRLHETMRQYAEERLDEVGAAGEIRRRHAEQYVSLAVEAEQRLRGPDEEVWVHRIDIEFANFETAVRWLIETKDADSALRIGLGLWRFGGPRLRYPVYRLVEAALAMPEARRHALYAPAFAQATMSSLTRSPGVQQMIERARLMDDAFAEAGVEFTSIARFVHAIIAALTGHLDHARTEATAAIDQALALGDRHTAAIHGALFSMLLASAGEADDAVQCAEDAFRLGVELGNVGVIAISHAALGVALSETDPENAIPHLETAIELGEQIDGMMPRDIALRALARIRTDRGELRAAFELFEIALKSAVYAGVPLVIATTCESLTFALMRNGDEHNGATIVGALQAISKDFPPNLLIRLNAATSALRRTMGDDQFEQHAAAGRTMTPRELAAFAGTAIERTLDKLEHQRIASSEP